MAKETVQFTIDLKINDGQLEAFESLAKAMSARTQTEPGALSYAWHLGADAGLGAEIFKPWQGFSR